MRTIAIATVLAAACGSGSNSAPPTDSKGPFLFRFEGKQTVTEVEWGKTEERSPNAGRIEKGKRIPGIVKGRFVTKPFTADGRQIAIDVAFDWGKNTGGITVDGKTCAVDMLNGGRGEVNDVRYRGFVGTCMLDGKQIEFMFGPVRGKDDKDTDDE